MKISELIKLKCDGKGRCDCLNAATRSLNGTKIGFTNFCYLDRNTGAMSAKTLYCFDPKAGDGEVGSILINFCPFCGTPFVDGAPAHEPT